MTLSVGILIFQDFEILDACGPIELLASYPEQFGIRLVAEESREIRCFQGPIFRADDLFEQRKAYDILLVPGGRGTRHEVANPAILNWIRAQSAQAQFVTSVCTGSALLAKAGVLDNRRATTNKLSFDWVADQGPDVRWEYAARWVEDGNIFTSSGVSAGMDMTLGLISRILGEKAAEDAALWAEYSWHRDADKDPFAKALNNRQSA